MESHEITELLIQLRSGRREALGELMPLVYSQLRSIARAQLGNQAEGHTLTTTAVVHEAYLKFFGQSQLDFNDRQHFFSVAAMAMRQIVVDQARRRQATKRGGDLVAIPLDELRVGSEDDIDEILSVDEALLRLCELDERLARLVELRYFLGLSVEETAEVLGVTPRTIGRDWRKARAWLYQTLKDAADP